MPVARTKRASVRKRAKAARIGFTRAVVAPRSSRVAGGPKYSAVQVRSGLPKESLRRVREKMGLTQAEFARITGLSPRSVAARESDQRLPSASVQRRLNEIVRLQKAMTRVISSESIRPWLDAPNKAFGGLKPIEVIERGETDRLWRMLFFLESGVAS